VRILGLFFILSPALVFAHSGALDKQGGHFNRKTDTYHCHREPCISTQSQVLEATKQAESDSFIKLYNRKDWPHWIDEDRDCQNTRQELLTTTSLVPVTFTNAKKCTVKIGSWFGMYTGKTYTNASDVDIDHVVALSNAHKSGGYNWTREHRRLFANDVSNLLVVSDKANRQKSDKAPDKWMPSDERYWCSYIAIWKDVKGKYNLALSDRELEVIERVSNETCDY
jgi:hypothetical protein